jgi:S-adenosylmethionine:tRNA ribosyltransferase-isomerase
MDESRRDEGGSPSVEDSTRLSTSHFDYSIDETLIAQRPLADRDASRMLVVGRETASLDDRTFSDLPTLIASGDVLVLNDTRVFPARLLGSKPTGAKAEILLLEPLEGDGLLWRALVRPGGKLKPGRRVEIGEGLEIAIEDSLEGGARIVRLLTDLEPREALDLHGHVPLPPYIRRGDDRADRSRYQTVYAEETGSVAAPTAGLHFTENVLEGVRARGADVAKVTLHVGPGTFRPVDAEDPEDHRLDSERYRVTQETADTINRCREHGGAIWAVGTTTVRTLESVADTSGSIRPGEGSTDLFIRPGYRFKAVDRLITNFHLPRSTLLMLVTAFAGYDLTIDAYRHAMENEYRFYSYGDAMVVT